MGSARMLRGSSLEKTLIASFFIAALVDGPGALRGDLVINEFLASSQAGLLDEDGDASDWIEVLNTGPEAVNLDRWGLTDDAAHRTVWLFPAVMHPPGAYLVIFASGKDRRVGGSELHASFKLQGGGDYLALLRPDGTVAQEFAPFPPQREDVGFGTALEPLPSPLVAHGARAAILIPADDSLGLSWTGGLDREPFEDSEAAGWIQGATGVGYESGRGGPRPLAYWDFDDASDPALAPDLSGNGNDAVLTSHFELAGSGASNRPIYTADGGGHTGSAGDLAVDFGLQGSGALVNVPAARLGAFNRAADADEITISLWLFGSARQPDNDVVFWGSSNPDGTGIRSLNAHVPWGDGVVYWDTAGCCDGTQRISKPESDATRWKGRWNHYVFMKDGDRKQIWQNGLLFLEGENVADLTPVRGFFLGGALNNGELSYGGKIDDVALWDRALMPAHVHALAQGASPLALTSFSHLIATDLGAAMSQKSASAYIRIRFRLEAAPDFDALFLRMLYKDGFVAYLNGVRVALRNAPADPRFNSTALTRRLEEEGLAVEELDLSAHVGLLRPGENVLAIHGLSHDRGSSDFFILPELVGARKHPARYLLPPTPGASNSRGVEGFVSDPLLSVDHGFFSAPFTVEVSCETPEAVIYFSTDGSEPRPAGAAAKQYSTPVSISRTTTLRAAAFREGFQPSSVVTRTYIFPDDVARQPARPPGLPATWSGFPADYQVDPDVVNTTPPGFGFTDSLVAIPTMSLTLDPADLFGSTSGIYSNAGVRDWERPASVEYFRPDGGPGFQVNAGVRIHGYTSRDHNFTPKHSFRLHFRSRYGAAKLRFQLFDDAEADRFDQLVLRGMSTDSWPVTDGWPSPIPGVLRWYREKATYLREQWMKDAQLDMGQLSTHARFVHLYLNGLYWGLYHLTERPTDSFLAEHLGGDREEYDAIKDFAEVQSGNGEAWTQMIALASAGLTAEAAYQRIQGNDPDGTRNPDLPRYVDVQNLIDYMIVHIYSGADDWPDHNWWGGRRRGSQSEGFRFFAWDQEITNISLRQTHSSWGVRFEEASAYNTPSFLYARMRANASFRQEFMDRVHKHLFNGGALSPEKNRERWMKRQAEIDQAIVGESARWGDSKRTAPYKREVEWLREMVWMRDEYWPKVHPIALERFRRVGLYPRLAAPVLSRHGGRIAPGSELAIEVERGSIHYTLDGSEPKGSAGAPSPKAHLYTGPIILPGSVLVKARALSGGQWSALTEASFFVDIPLRITELHYHPADPPEGSAFGDDDFEFIELQNVGGRPLDLRGISITGAVEFLFREGGVTSLEPAAVVVAAADGQAFSSRYDLKRIPYAGAYSGRLSNDGERIQLVGPAGEPIQDFRFDDAWYPETDGAGRSLVIREAGGDPEAWGLVGGWRPSRELGGSPGAGESAMPPGGRQLPGDADQDASLGIADAVRLLWLLFLGGVPPPCEGQVVEGGNLVLLDLNGDRSVGVSDAVHLLHYLFLDGPEPAAGAECIRLPGCPEACAP